MSNTNLVNKDGVIKLDAEDDKQWMITLLKGCYSIEIDLPTDNVGVVTVLKLALKYLFKLMLPPLLDCLISVEAITDVSMLYACLGLDFE